MCKCIYIYKYVYDYICIYVYNINYEYRKIYKYDYKYVYINMYLKYMTRKFWSEDRGQRSKKWGKWGFGGDGVAGEVGLKLWFNVFRQWEWIRLEVLSPAQVDGDVNEDVNEDVNLKNLELVLVFWGWLCYLYEDVNEDVNCKKLCVTFVDANFKDEDVNGDVNE